jgi:hypothetical protein
MTENGSMPIRAAARRLPPGLHAIPVGCLTGCHRNRSAPTSPVSSAASHGDAAGAERLAVVDAARSAATPA